MAMGLAAIAGCGDPEGGGVPASRTAALTPVAPIPADRDVKIAPPPLTPGPVAAAAPGAGQPASGQPVSGQPDNGQPAGTFVPGQANPANPGAPATSPAPTAAAPGAQPFNFNLFGNSTAPKPKFEKARVGIGAQGRDYGEGMVATPLSAYFSAKQQIVFNIQLPHAMKEFNAFNNRNPKSQQEFDEKIIKEYGIHLPELPAGQTYAYDPKSGELTFGPVAK